VTSSHRSFTPDPSNRPDRRLWQAIRRTWSAIRPSRSIVPASPPAARATGCAKVRSAAHALESAGTLDPVAGTDIRLGGAARSVANAGRAADFDRSTSRGVNRWPGARRSGPAGAQDTSATQRRHDRTNPGKPQNKAATQRPNSRTDQGNPPTKTATQHWSAWTDPRSGQNTTAAQRWHDWTSRVGACGAAAQAGRAGDLTPAQAHRSSNRQHNRGLATAEPNLPHRPGR